MIKIASQPDFWTDVEFIAPGGEVAGTCRMKWKAISRSAFNDMMTKPADVILPEVLLDWEGIDDKFMPENVNRLIDLIPSAARVMLDSYVRGLFGSERKN